MCPIPLSVTGSRFLSTSVSCLLANRHLPLMLWNVMVFTVPRQCIIQQFHSQVVVKVHRLTEQDANVVSLHEVPVCNQLHLVEQSFS